ncbi:alpha/beta fold hydrolase [Frondihabitans australicus]|uniref:Pimeloyl-ACP methyl ester carboxylesterase n=1 Tax=Frondihabitans australicus TaxID=386892 RepID=A0A495IBC0_9MICO|nr:alpha/beta hydrolase [Frondihabitans australicus]RKR73294.1 pimeloyl-ACP methyl ester carboxylesterase [Frondihabitans australicus]
MADRIFALSSGRGVAFSASGDALARRLVVFCLPTGMAGAFDPDPLITDTWGVRLITLDRPGYGSSAVLPLGEAPSIDGRTDDVAEYIQTAETVADEVSKADFGKIGVIGWGAGAEFAAALAARHPELVDRLALVAPRAPHHAGRDERHSGLVEALRARPGHSVEAVATEIADTGWADLSSVGIADDDPAYDTNAGLRHRLERSVAEAATQGSLGVAGDLIAFRDSSWHSGVGDVTADTLIVTGATDDSVDEKQARWYGSRIAGAEMVSVPEAGHLVIATEWDRILRHVAPKHGGLPPEIRQ